MKQRLAIAGFVAAAAVAIGCTPPPAAPPPLDTSELQAAVTLDGVRAHQQALQDIADANDGTRAAGTEGHDESAAYVFELLDNAGYDVELQTFTYARFSETSPSTMTQVSPTPTAYVNGTDFLTMDYSGSGDVTATVQAVDLVLPPTGGSTSGCEQTDFAAFTPGNIALMQRGTCNFRVKIDNAAAAGAVAGIIFNEGNSPDRLPLLGGTLSPPLTPIPALGIPFALGSSLNDQIATGLTLHVTTATKSTSTETDNVIATSATGTLDDVVVVGAHLDSVTDGPGINDNGSGTAANLEVALQMAALNIQPRNAVRFAFWSAEEDGLIGSTHYVNSLTNRERASIALNLNFDMVGSPNFVNFIYDGDGDAFGTAGPTGSDQIEETFEKFFAGKGLGYAPTAFDGRSDYKAFIDNGIPAGGLFTGAEGTKTPEQAAVFGGTAGQPYDPCYHQACDTIDNYSPAALDQNSDAIADSVLRWAMEDTPFE